MQSLVDSEVLDRAPATEPVASLSGLRVLFLVVGAQQPAVSACSLS